MATTMAIVVKKVTASTVYYTLLSDESHKMYNYTITRGSTVNFWNLEINTAYYVCSKANVRNRYIWTECYKARSEEQPYNRSKVVAETKYNKKFDEMFDLD